MPVALERQLQDLAGQGIRLNAGVSVDELLRIFERQDYEELPYLLLLRALGAERNPGGQRASPDVWALDAECVQGPGVYARVVHELARLAGQSQRLGQVRDSVDLRAGEASVSYTVDGKSRTWNAEVQGDWLDLMVLSSVAGDFEDEGRFFALSQEGQDFVLLYLDEPRLESLNKLSGGAFERLNPL